MFLSKSVNIIKDLDVKKGIVAFYFSAFENVDRQNEIVKKTAFNNTIKNNKKVAHLLNHDINQNIGRPLELGVDDKGAFMVSQLSKTQLGQETLQKYEEGIYNQHSFLGECVKSYMQDDIKIIQEIRLYEASTVSIAANPETPVISIKAFEEILKKDIDKEILKKLDFIIEALSLDKDPSETVKLDKEPQEKIIKELDYNYLIQLLDNKK